MARVWFLNYRGGQTPHMSPLSGRLRSSVVVVVTVGHDGFSSVNNITVDDIVVSDSLRGHGTVTRRDDGAVVIITIAVPRTMDAGGRGVLGQETYTNVKTHDVSTRGEQKIKSR